MVVHEDPPGVWPLVGRVVPDAVISAPRRVLLLWNFAHASVCDHAPASSTNTTPHEQRTHLSLVRDQPFDQHPPTPRERKAEGLTARLYFGQ
jgi:hypothetical protein